MRDGGKMAVESEVRQPHGCGDESCGCEAGPAVATDTYGCPCCAPVLQDIGLLTLPDLRHTAARIDRRGRVREQAVGTTVFLNANVLTVDADFSTAEALAIRDGRVLAVGSADDVRAAAGEDATVVDGAGRTILPGFIEPHMHFFPVAMLATYVDVGPLVCDSVEAVIEKLAGVASETPAGEWIVARQFDPSLQDGPDVLTTDMLDPATPDHPVLLLNASLHFGYCNTRAFEAAGIGKDTANPPGAEFVRLSDGTPNGVLQGGAAMFRVLAASGKALKSDGFEDACRMVCEKANAAGFTTVCDQATGGFQGPGEIEAFHAFARSGALTVRMRYSLLDGMFERWEEMGMTPGEGDEWVRATGWKIVSDGSNQGRTGLQREPYLNRNTFGTPYLPFEDLKAKVAKRAGEGWQLVVHANGDAAIDRALDAFEEAYGETDCRPLRFRIEHCSLLHDEQIARIAEMGLSPSFLIGHVHYWGKAFRDEIFGPEKANLLGRARSVVGGGGGWGEGGSGRLPSSPTLRARPSRFAFSGPKISSRNALPQ